VEAVLTNSLHTNSRAINPFSRTAHMPSSWTDQIPPRAFPEADLVAGRPSKSGATVEIVPRELVKRRVTRIEGLTIDIVQATRRETIEYRFRAPFHMLVAYEQGTRAEGVTLVEGVPQSNLRDLKNKLTFVPAGHEYRERQDLRTLSRITFFYFDPAKMPLFSERGAADLAPRLYFENAGLWDTAIKLAKLAESGSADSELYLAALGAVLVHELVRFNAGSTSAQPLARGGLAAWQQRIVTDYIEEHLAESISLATLAQLVRLSTYHFCRAFKQSFGVPPHRYHTAQRIERAKALLAKPSPSVTDIGLTVGFSQTSSFTAAFRRATGQTPTAYYRGLA
jgi:AraC family transcriptional regulator